MTRAAAGQPWARRRDLTPRSPRVGHHRRRLLRLPRVGPQLARRTRRGPRARPRASSRTSTRSGNRFDPNKLLIDPYTREISHDPLQPGALSSSPYRHGPDVARRRRRTARAEVDRLPARHDERRARTRRARCKDDVVYEVHVRGLTMNDTSVPAALQGTYAGAATKARRARRARGHRRSSCFPIHETQNDQNDVAPAERQLLGLLDARLLRARPALRVRQVAGRADARVQGDGRGLPRERHQGLPRRRLQPHGRGRHLDRPPASPSSSPSAASTTPRTTSSPPTTRRRSTTRAPAATSTSPAASCAIWSSTRSRTGAARWASTASASTSRRSSATRARASATRSRRPIRRASSSAPATELPGVAAHRRAVGRRHRHLPARQLPRGLVRVERRLPRLDPHRAERARDDAHRAEQARRRRSPARPTSSTTTGARRGRRSTTSTATTASRCTTSTRTTRPSTTRPTRSARPPAGARRTTRGTRAASAAAQTQAARTGLALVALSAGVPMIQGGDEMLRTQSGNNNAYNLDDSAMWLDPTLATTNAGFVAWTTALFAFRAAHAALRPATFWDGTGPRRQRPARRRVARHHGRCRERGVPRRTRATTSSRGASTGTEAVGLRALALRRVERVDGEHHRRPIPAAGERQRRGGSSGDSASGKLAAPGQETALTADDRHGRGALGRGARRTLTRGCAATAACPLGALAVEDPREIGRPAAGPRLAMRGLHAHRIPSQARSPRSPRHRLQPRSAHDLRRGSARTRTRTRTRARARTHARARPHARARLRSPHPPRHRPPRRSPRHRPRRRVPRAPRRGHRLRHRREACLRFPRGRQSRARPRRSHGPVRRARRRRRSRPSRSRSAIRPAGARGRSRATPTHPGPGRPWCATSVAACSPPPSSTSAAEPRWRLLRLARPSARGAEDAHAERDAQHALGHRRHRARGDLPAGSRRLARARAARAVRRSPRH